MIVISLKLGWTHVNSRWKLFIYYASVISNHMHIFRGNLYKTTERSDLKSNKKNQPKMKISLIISLKSVFGFGYTSTKAVSNLLWIILFHQNRHNSGTIRLFFRFQVKEQILDCKEAAVLCNALCGNHDADHQAFQEINKDDAFDATVNVARQNGMYKNQEMCRICSSKWKNDFLWPHSDTSLKDSLGFGITIIPVKVACKLRVITL